MHVERQFNLSLIAYTAWNHDKKQEYSPRNTRNTRKSDRTRTFLLGNHLSCHFVYFVVKKILSAFLLFERQIHIPGGGDLI